MVLAWIDIKGKVDDDYLGSTCRSSPTVLHASLLVPWWTHPAPCILLPFFPAFLHVWRLCKGSVPSACEHKQVGFKLSCAFLRLRGGDELYGSQVEAVKACSLGALLVPCDSVPAERIW